MKTSEEIELWLFQQSKNNPTRCPKIQKAMETKKWYSEEEIREAIKNLKENLILTDYMNGSKYGEYWFSEKINLCLKELFGEEK